tara:strand:- start:1021 stop:1422 length:402 start_codon:yes stop_codon:yes gene_type:complete
MGNTNPNSSEYVHSYLLHYLNDMDLSRLELYDKIIEKCPRFERKGKSMPHTSANGYMFTALNKDGEIGVRFSKEVQEKYMKRFGTSFYRSYGAIMKGYVLIPKMMFNDLDYLADLFDESYDHVMSLPPKTSKD